MWLLSDAESFLNNQETSDKLHAIRLMEGIAGKWFGVEFACFLKKKYPAYLLSFAGASYKTSAERVDLLLTDNLPVPSNLVCGIRCQAGDWKEFEKQLESDLMTMRQAADYPKDRLLLVLTNNISSHQNILRKLQEKEGLSIYASYIAGCEHGLICCEEISAV